jgi:hypothetical protein
MKKFLFLLFWIFFGISCEKLQKEEEPPPPPPGFGAIHGSTFIGSTNEPLQGFKATLAGYPDQITDKDGIFKFENILEGKHIVNIYKGSNILAYQQANVQAGIISTIKFPFEYSALPKDPFPDFSVVDVSKDCAWDYWVVGKKEYFYIDAENSLPKSVFYHSFENGKNYGIFFDSKGLPSKVITDNFIFLFDNFLGGKVDLGILTPSGEMKIARGIPTDLTSSPKSGTSSNDAQAKAELIRFTGRVIGAIPCITFGAASLISGGAAIPLALWTCGNYLAGMAKNFMDDANVENGFTRFVGKYNLGSTQYACTTDPASCLISLASKGLDSYADYVEEMEEKEEYLARLDILLNNIAPLREIVIQPGSEGKDAWIRMSGWSDCSETYFGSGSDSLLKIIQEGLGGCVKEVDKSFLQFYLGHIPVNAKIFSAKLEVYGFATIHSGIPTLSLNKLKSSWGEDIVSWKNQPESEPISNIDFVHEGMPSWYSWDVTSIIKDWIILGDNFGFGIFAAKSGMYSIICSSDHPYAAHRPKLVVLYY